MAVVTLFPNEGAGKAPTLSTPQIRAHTIETSLHLLGDYINVLLCVADSAALTEAEDKIIENLYFTHRQLQREHEKLCALL